MDSLNLSSTPQFSKAEYGKPAECSQCKQPFAGAYFIANGRTLCGPCGERLKREGSIDRPGAFIKALLVGSVAAIIGLVLYAGFTILTGFYVGYVSLAVGFIVGKGITIGSGGIGGRKYQIAALILTYAAVSMAAIPIAFHQMSIAGKTQQEVRQGAAGSTPGATSQPATPGDTEKDGEKMSFGAAMARLALIGLASPFLELSEGIGGFIGLIILLVGLRIAWRITGRAPLEISGPFDAATAASRGAS